MTAITLERRPPPSSPVVRVMTAVNLACMFAVLLGWQVLGPQLEVPIMLITGQDILPDSTIFAYPYVLLWLAPLAGVTGVVVAKMFERRTIVKLIAFFPMILALSCGIWLYALSPYFD